MKVDANATEVRMIDVTRVDVLNPRERNDKVFDEIVGSIKRVGLKKPITVTPRTGDDGTERFLLVCGEGRLKAFKACARRPNLDHPCRLNIDQGWKPASLEASCG